MSFLCQQRHVIHQYLERPGCVLPLLSSSVNEVCVCVCPAGTGWIHRRRRQLLERGLGAAAQQTALLGLCKSLQTCFNRTIWMVYCLLLENVWTGPVDIYCNALSRLSTFTIKKPLVGDEAALNSQVTSTDVFCLVFFHWMLFLHIFCVYEGNILCLLRSCLRLCGVGCFIPWEDNRPASLTGTWWFN